MKTTSLIDVPFTDLAQQLVNLLGGKAFLGEGNNSVLIERKSGDGNKYKKLEVAKSRQGTPPVTIYSLEVEEGITVPKKVISTFKAKDLNNLYITISEKNEPESKKITFITISEERYNIIEVDETFKVVIVSNPGKGKKIEKGPPKEVKRKFVEL